jgi:hypothetical protein
MITYRIRLSTDWDGTFYILEKKVWWGWLKMHRYKNDIGGTREKNIVVQRLIDAGYGVL